jgi:hypothetical protein
MYIEVTQGGGYVQYIEVPLGIGSHVYRGYTR